MKTKMKPFPALLLVAGMLAVASWAVSGQTITYSTGGVNVYVANGCPGPDLPATIPEVQKFRNWYNMNSSFSLFSSWQDADVWGPDFTNATGSNNNDLEPQGGSDVPMVYLYAGHGICQNPPNSTSPDFIAACGNVGANNIIIGNNSRWGNSTGNLRFMFVDASCPMDLVSLSNQWFPVFQGLHVATGHSGTTTQDALDSDVRGNNLAAFTSNAMWFLPHMSVGDAWMSTGIDDVQDGCCAVVIAGGNGEADAVDRRDREKVLDNRSDPVATWAAWRWICR